MSTHFSKVLSSGQRVKIDDVAVSVDASRYPTRNISAVHMSRANKPNLLILLLAVVASIFAVLLAFAGTMVEINGSNGYAGGAPMFTGAGLIIVFAFFLFSKVKTPYHTISFGSSGNDKDLIAIKATSVSKVGLLSVISKWEEHTQETYLELLACADAINEAIEELQKQDS